MRLIIFLLLFISGFAYPASLTSDRVEGISASVAFKAPVRVATTANITLSGLQTIDGVTVVANDRVLVKSQTTSSQNGIYVAASTAWTRAPDFDGNRDVVRGTVVRVNSGTTLGGTAWGVSASDPITIGTTSLTWEQVNFGTLSSTTITATGGNTSSTLANRFGEILNVKTDFGAACDGSTDDSTAFANAIASGKSIQFPDAATCRIVTKLTFNQNHVTYYGRGTKILFDGTYTTRLADISGTNITFEGMRFSGNSKQVYGYLLYVTSAADGVTFRDVWVGEVTGTRTGGPNTPANQQIGLGINPYSKRVSFIGGRFHDITQRNDGTDYISVWSATVTGGGAGYTAATAAFSGGSAVVTATASVTVNAGAVTALTITARGVYPAGQTPTITISGDGAGATATAVMVNGVEGYGFATGIHFMTEDFSEPTTVQSEISNFLIDGVQFYNIRTVLAGGLNTDQVDLFDDGDCVRTYGNTTGATNLPITVINSIFDRCSKRAIKMSVAKNFRAINNIVFAANLTYGMSAAIKNDSEHSVIDGLKVFASASKPVNSAIINHDGNYASVRNVWVSHATTFSNIQPTNSDAKTGFLFENIHVENLYASGFVKTGSFTPSTVTFTRYENITMIGADASVSCFTSLIGADNLTGAKVRNLTCKNADAYFSGLDNDVDGIDIEVTDTAFVGSSSTRSLLDYGYAAATLSTKNTLRNARIRMGINPATTYLTASRPRLVWFRGDAMNITNVQVYANSSLSIATYPHIEVNGSDNIIDQIQLNSNGIFQIGGSGTHSRNTLSRAIRTPTSTSGESFIYLVGVANGTWISEVQDNNALSASDYTVLSDGTSAGNIWLSNIRSRSFPTGAAVNLTAGTMILDGKRYASATWNPASIADGDNATTTVTVTGAVLGESVEEVSFSLDLQGLVLTGYVSATNTVTVVLANNTGAAVDLASGTIRVGVRIRQQAVSLESPVYAANEEFYERRAA